MFKKLYKGVVKLLQAYIRNVFDGKITSLVGFTLVLIGIIKGFQKDSTYVEVSEFVVLGLVIAGFKDPRIGKQDNSPQP